MNKLKLARWKSGSILAAIAGVVLLGVLAINLLPSWRIDFTEDNLFTLSQGTRQIVQDFEAPVELTLYFSDKVTAEIPQLRDYAKRVRDLLTEYNLVDKEKIKLSVVDPEPFSEAEDSATAAGLQAVPNGPGGDNIFFGLVGENNEGKKEIIPFFDPSREEFLEYDISQLLYRLQNTHPPVVGIMTSLQVFGGFDFVSQRSSPAWVIVQQLRQSMTVRQLSPTLETIEPDISLLVIIHPQDLPPITQYAIDQFVLKSGKAIVFVDPHSEAGAAPSRDASSSDLSLLFSAWGVGYDSTKILGDAQWAMRLPAGSQRIPLPHLAYLALGTEAMDADDITSTNLETINLALAGILTPLADAETEFRPLLQSSQQSNILDAERFIGLMNHGDLLNDFKPSGERHTLAARVRGKAKTAFPDGVPKPYQSDSELDPEQEQRRHDQDNAEPVEPQVLTADDINVMVIADTDLLTDRLWVQVNNFFGQSVAAPWANNGDFVSNAVENMAGSSALISVRSRGNFARPFDLVEDLQRSAAERFREQEQVLQQKLANLEQKIQSLSKDDQGQMILALNEAQQREIKTFEAEKLGIRKQLRQVQHQLNSDIESLEMRLKLINILLVPLLLTVGSLVLMGVRSRRRKSVGSV